MAEGPDRLLVEILQPDLSRTPPALRATTPMPMLELTYSEGALERHARATLVEQLTGALMRWEGAPDTEFFPRGDMGGHPRAGGVGRQPRRRAGRPADLRALGHCARWCRERPSQGRPHRRGHQAHPRRRRRRRRQAARLGAHPRDPRRQLGRRRPGHPIRLPEDVRGQRAPAHAAIVERGLQLATAQRATPGSS
jgi:hypothetical protein